MTQQAYYKKTPKKFRGILYKVKFFNRNYFAKYFVNYFLVESAIFEESAMLPILEAESLTAAGAVVVESVVTVVVVVESVFVSEDDELPPHEVMKAAIAMIARNFFICFLI